MQVLNEFFLESEEIDKISTFDFEVILVDDNKQFMEGFSQKLFNTFNFKNLYTASSGPELLFLLRLAVNFDYVFLDYEMPEMNAFEVLKAINEYNQITCSEVKVVLLTHINHPVKLKCAVEYGVIGVIHKSFEIDDIIRNIGKVLSGERVFSNIYNSVTSKLNDEYGKSKLTSKELEILLYLCDYLDEEQIGAKLKISPLTVKNHKQNIMKKYNLTSHRELLEYFNKIISANHLAF